MFNTQNTVAYREKGNEKRLTAKQKRFISELPKSNFVISRAMKNSGYSETTATKRQDIVMKSPNLQKALADLGVTNDVLMKEYKKIWIQDSDLTNKRLSLERSAEFINPELAQNKGFSGTTNNTINVFGADALAKMSELQAELSRLDSVKPQIVEGEVENIV